MHRMNFVIVNWNSAIWLLSQTWLSVLMLSMIGAGEIHLQFVIISVWLKVTFEFDMWHFANKAGTRIIVRVGWCRRPQAVGPERPGFTSQYPIGGIFHSLSLWASENLFPKLKIVLLLWPGWCKMKWNGMCAIPEIYNSNIQLYPYTS